MATDKPKISGYVPENVYRCFKNYQTDMGVTMSQALIVILTEFFGLEGEINVNNEGRSIGGVTLAEFAEFKARLIEVEEAIAQMPKFESSDSQQQLEIPIVPLEKKQGKVENSQYNNIPCTALTPLVNEWDETNLNEDMPF